MVIGRLRPGTDLIEGIIALVEEYDVRAGVIISCVGSLGKATFLLPVPDPSSKVGAVYGNPIEIVGPLAFLSGGGLISRDKDGEVLIHFHGLVSDVNRKVYGGHFKCGGNPVLATMEVLIAELQDLELVRRYDEEVGFVVTWPYPASKERR